MIKIIRLENECVDCGLTCLGPLCPHKSVKHFYCDECGEEDELFEFDGEDLCIDCIKKRLKCVNEEE